MIFDSFSYAVTAVVVILIIMIIKLAKRTDTEKKQHVKEVEE